jgi:dTDP-4-dehydrorhamnose reductase
MTNAGAVLVVGGSGQVGQQLIRVFEQAGRGVTATYYRNPKPGLEPLDATDAGQVAGLFAKVNPTVVINSLNAAGGTDACELDPALAERSHFTTGRNLADQAQRFGSKFVQISTDYVFDGEAGPYRETDPPHPLSQLGRAKLRLEEYVLKTVPEALVVRTSFIFSWTPDSKTKNFVMQVFDACRERRPMPVPVDQVGNLTYAPNFVGALVELIRLDAAGLYHVAGTTRCSKYEWALKVADYFGLDATLIRGLTTKELGQAGPRPLESGFVLDKAQGALKQTRLMSLEEGLADMKQHMAAGVRLA